MNDIILNPAQKAFKEAAQKMYKCIDDKKCFLIEAGAGAGKTSALIEALKYILKTKKKDLLRNHQHIACITFTNVAVDEIRNRTDGHPAILASTIHSFCWSLIKDFQPILRKKLLNIQTWSERLKELEIEDISSYRVEYELGHPTVKVDDKCLDLHHDDIISLTIKFLEYPKFRDIFISKYPILLIDEYQDTKNEFAKALLSNFLDELKKPLIGFFGDHWQKIYGDGVGKINHIELEYIGVNANFRSVPVIVNILNRIRPELRQNMANPEAKGSAEVYHTNNWNGRRLNKQHWSGDLPNDVAHKYLEVLQKLLFKKGWNFKETNKTKILMLTHRNIASEIGYPSFVDIFPFNDSYIKKEDSYIKFLMETVEPVSIAYQNKRYGEMFSIIGRRLPIINSQSDKIEWASAMDKLLNLRDTGTIGDILDHLENTHKPHLSDAIEQKELEIEQILAGSDDSYLKIIEKLKGVSYKEIIALYKFVEGYTPFSTKHGVKGAEFENILVVFGRGWDQYNFNKFLELANNKPPTKDVFYESNRNLFYVACSRAKTRLVLFFTQKLSENALTTLKTWFGEEAIHSLHIN